MYEEEDDGINRFAMQLPYHLHTGTLGDKFSAYLSANVGIRRQLDEALRSSYSLAPDQGMMSNPMQGYNPMFNPNPTTMSNAVLNNVPGPMSSPMPNQMSAPMMNQVQASSRPQSFQHPMNFRTSPYPTQQQRFQSSHKRSSSFAVPSPINTADTAQDDARRSSNPVGTASHHASANGTPAASPAAMTNGQQPFSPASTASPLNQVSVPANTFSSNMATTFNNTLGSPDYGHLNGQDAFPLSTALPANDQMALGSAISPDSFLMAGSHNLPQYQGPSAYHSFQNAIAVGKGGQLYPSYEGLNSTLAPSAPSSQSQVSSAEETPIFSYDSFFGNEETSINESWNDFDFLIDPNAWEELTA
ncbi:hypothetical protein ACMFMG_003980 [Clarireedia jacksonii]